MGAHFEGLNEPVLMAPSDSRYTKVGFNLFSVQVCKMLTFFMTKSSLFDHNFLTSDHIELKFSVSKNLQDWWLVGYYNTLPKTSYPFG